VPLIYDEDPKNIGRHSEDTQAVYGTLRFGFEEWKLPVEGNLGLRVVRSKAVAHGYEIFNTSYSEQTPPDLPRFDAIARPIEKDHSYVKTLPSLNLKADLTSTLQGRLALAQSLYRPGFRGTTPPTTRQATPARTRATSSSSPSCRRTSTCPWSGIRKPVRR
jgi:outer membrane receptor protein involved in Fe transport